MSDPACPIFLFVSAILFSHTNRFSVHIKPMMATQMVATVANIIARTSTPLVSKTVIRKAMTKDISLFETVNRGGKIRQRSIAYAQIASANGKDSATDNTSNLWVGDP
jgi:hypothetical protein